MANAAIVTKDVELCCGILLQNEVCAALIPDTNPLESNLRGNNATDFDAHVSKKGVGHAFVLFT